MPGLPGSLRISLARVPVYSGYRSIEPALSAAKTMPVLPRPGRCTALPAARTRISPRMYDSVKRFEPTFSGSPRAAPVAAMHSTATKNLSGTFHRSRRAAQELQAGEARVQAALLHQLGMGALR